MLEFIGFPDKRLPTPSPQYQTPPNATATPVSTYTLYLPAASHCQILSKAD
jgi:hypothetical protein